MTARNPHESYNRMLKVAALVRAIDAARIEVPECSLVSLNGWLRLQTPEWWSELAKQAKIRPPSALTIEAVLLTLEARDESEQGEVEPDWTESRDACDLTGKKYSYLTVVGFGERRARGRQYRYMWRCICDCGAPTIVEYWNLCTDLDNMHDKIRKGRARYARKLTDEQVRAILMRVREETQLQLAREFGISRSVISGIASGKAWRHIARAEESAEPEPDWDEVYDLERHS